MPANKFVANSAILKLYWIIGGELVINVLGAVKPSGLTIAQTTADALATTIKASFSARLAAQYATTSSLQRIGIRDYSFANMPEFRDTLAPVAGTDPGEALPAGLACCVGLRTAQAGKRGRGRVYLSGWSEAANGPSGLQLASVNTNAIQFVNDIDTALISATMSLAVIGRASLAVRITKVTTETDGSLLTEVISNQAARAGQVLDVNAVIALNAKWEHQRRRDNGRGGGLSALGSVARLETAR